MINKLGKVGLASYGLVILFVWVITLTVLLSACSEASTASSNLSEDADAFRVLRRVTYFNTMTGDVLFVAEGNISLKVDPEERQLEITSKTGEDEYKKHFFGLSETVTYVAEQLDWKEEDKYKFKIVFNTPMPDLEINK